MPVYRLRGVVQHYAWGGTDYLPALLRRSNSEPQPWAEYWLGVHPKGEAQVVLPEGSQPLSALLKQQADLLANSAESSFSELPFLLKVLDVEQMLSIQLHPTREKAQKGFAQEEEAGIPRLAPNRNYKDRNHKPELMVALTDFWLLHGFRSEADICSTLEQVPGWIDLQDVLDEKGVRGLYQTVMEANQDRINSWLNQLYNSLQESASSLSKDKPEYWAWKAFQQYTKEGQHDRGIFSIYWFNLVQLKPGQGIFQGAGIPHAYLGGVNVELMANSDNVLRGGLTPKHIDVPELLDNIITDAVVPQIMEAEQRSDGAVVYPVPVPDFKLQRIQLGVGEKTELFSENAAIVLVMEGALEVDGEKFQAGDSFLLGAGNVAVCKHQGTSGLTLFVASF